MLIMRLRTFLQALIRSIVSPQYYVDVLNAPFKFSLRFFLIGYFLLSLLATLAFVQFDIPHYQSIFAQNQDTLEKNYPTNLIIGWDGKQLADTTPRVIEVSYPTGVPHEGFPTKLANIDTAATSIDQVKKEAQSASLFVVTKETVYVSNNQGEWSPLSLKDTPGFDQPFHITKDSLPNFISVWRTTFDSALHAFAFLYPFLFFFIIGFFRIITLLVSAGFIYYLLRLLNKNIPYLKVVQLGLHVLVVAGLLDILTAHFIPENVDPGIYGIAFWLYIGVIVISLWNVKNVVLFKKTDKK